MPITDITFIKQKVLRHKILLWIYFADIGILLISFSANISVARLNLIKAIRNKINNSSHGEMCVKCKMAIVKISGE